MWNIQFWQSWTKQNRLFFYIASLLFFGAMIYMWVSYAYTPAPAVELQTIQEPELREVAVGAFQKGPFNFTIQGNNYVILQRQLGTALDTDIYVAYAYALVVALFIVGMLAIISTLGRFYYLAGMGVFILFVVTLSPEVLGVLGMYGKTFSIVLLALYCLPSFYLFYFMPEASFRLRVAVFAVVTIVVWASIFFFSQTALPFLFISTYALEAGLIATVLFIVTVAHEIVAGFLYAVTQTNRQNKSLNHFLIITTIYLVNLVLSYSIRFGFIRWNLITVDLFLLLSISAILGLWGMRQRGKLFEGIIDAEPYAIYAFMLVGMFAFATIGMLMNNANDAALVAVRDAIIFAHLGFGTLFVMYVLSNFINMLGNNMAVYKVMYSPQNMPFFTFRLAGLIATLALVFYNTWQVPVHNAMGGYFNGIASLYEKIGNDRVAKVYFEQARTYSFRNHHANYALANMEGASFNPAGEQNFYREASGLRPTQMSVLNWAQTYQSAGQNTGAISVLQEGIKKMKDHASLENTLGLLYARAGVTDSATKYIDKSKANSNFKRIAFANNLGLMAAGWLPVGNDTTIRDNPDDVIQANLLALLNRTGHDFPFNYQLPKDTVLTLANAAGINNYLINRRTPADTTFINQVIGLARRPSNYGFKEALMFASSIAMYNAGETRNAFLLLEEVTSQSDQRGRYNNTLTLWALDNNEQKRALDYVDYAVRQGYAPAIVTHATTLTELTSADRVWIDSAVVAWNSVSKSTDSITMQLSRRMKNVLSMSPNSALSELTDEDKYAFARYRFSLTDSSAIYGLVASVQNDNIKAKMLLELAERHFEQDHAGAALNVLSKIAGLELTDRSLGERMTILEMLARVQLGQAAAILDALKQNPVSFEGRNKKYRIYFEALRASAAGDSLNAANNFRWLGRDPFFEDGVIAAAKYFRGKGMTSYQMMADAIQYHPSSIRIRKAYAVEAASSGFGDYALAALADLKSMISSADYNRLAAEVQRLAQQRAN